MESWAAIAVIVVTIGGLACALLFVGILVYNAHWDNVAKESAASEAQTKLLIDERLKPTNDKIDHLREQVNRAVASAAGSMIR